MQPEGGCPETRKSAHRNTKRGWGEFFIISALRRSQLRLKAQLPQRDRWLVLSGRLHVILRGVCARTTRGDDPKRNKRPESKGETWSMQGHAFTQCMLRWAGPTNLSIKLDCRTKTREKIRDTAVIYTRKETFKTREIRACERACNWSPYQRHGCSYIIEKAVDIPAPIESRSCAVYGRNRRS